MSGSQKNILDISRQVSDKIGDDFFRALVLELSEALDCDYALIAEVDMDIAQSTILGLCADGKILENFSYSLEGTPCANVSDTGVCIYPSNVQAQFPDDEILKSIDADSFVGIGLLNSKGECIGLLEVLDRKPIKDPEKAEALLRVFGARASAEIERQHLNATLQENVNAYRTLFELSSDSHLLIDASELTIVDCNNSAISFFGTVCKQALVGKSTAHLFGEPNSTLHSVLNIVLPEAELSATEQFHRTETKLINHSKQAFFVEITTKTLQVNGESRILLVIRDLTETHKILAELERSQKKYQFLAFNDPLTGLQNRRSLQNKLRTLESSADKNSVYMMILDLDNFKEVNDTLGHIVGDRLLKLLAKRLLQILPEHSASLFRLGGDEFAVLLEGYTQEKVEVISSSLAPLIEKPFSIDDMDICINCSIGIANFTPGMSSSSDLMRAADIAMYQSKSSGSEPYQFYDAEMDVYSRKRLQVISDLRSALNRDEIIAYFQPKIDLSDMSIVGFEALARWQHPEQGMINPAVFIDIAEVSNNIQALTDKVLKDACRVLSQLANNERYSMAVNISPKVLLESSLVEKLTAIRESYGVLPHQLELEITESTLMRDPERALEIATKVANTGMTLSVDDFGTGYSSLAYLKRLPVSTLKIDREFVKDMADDDQDKVIVRSVIDLAKNLGLGVVAEGIENKPTQTLLQAMGCQQAQGYLYAKQMPENELINWIDQWADSNTS